MTVPRPAEELFDLAPSEIDPLPRQSEAPGRPRRGEGWENHETSTSEFGVGVYSRMWCGTLWMSKRKSGQPLGQLALRPEGLRCNRRLRSDAPLPPTTPGSPRVHPRPTSENGVLECFVCVCVRCKKHCVSQGFVRVENATRRRRRHAKMLCFSRVVSVMRAARTGFIVISWVSGALQHQWRQMSSKMTCQRTQHRFQIPIQFQRERERETERHRDRDRYRDREGQSSP